MGEFTPAPVQPVVRIEALEALDIRVGTIERVEDVAHSDKLMKLTVHFGDIHERFLPGSRKSAKTRERSKAGRHCLL